MLLQCLTPMTGRELPLASRAQQANGKAESSLSSQLCPMEWPTCSLQSSLQSQQANVIRMSPKELYAGAFVMVPKEGSPENCCEAPTRAAFPDK